MRVAVYSIALNEKQFVDRWYESAAEADYILIADTGSTDGMAEYAESLGITVYRIKVSPWRFDDAKNAALNLLPKDIDVAISMDMDEVLLPGWREMLEVTWEKDATILNHKYRHNGGAWQWHSKIHARHNCKWTGAVHETLSWSVPEKAIWSDGIFLDEWQDVTKSRRSYLDLLHKKINEGDTDWRTRYFLANDYQSVGDLEKAIFWRTESYDICNEGSIVKSYIARNIADNYNLLGNNDSALNWLNISLSQSRERETLYDIAKLYSAVGDHRSAYDAAIDCLKVEERRDGFTHNPAAWGYGPYDIVAMSSYYLGDMVLALEYGKKALELDPENIRLAHNLKWYEEANDK
jgi:glycosyltransferase involved in cell wall biosynthesis